MSQSVRRKDLRKRIRAERRRLDAIAPRPRWSRRERSMLRQRVRIHTPLTPEEKALFNRAYDAAGWSRRSGWLTNDLLVEVALVSVAIIVIALFASLLIYVIVAMTTDTSWLLFT